MLIAIPTRGGRAYINPDQVAAIVENGRGNLIIKFDGHVDVEGDFGEVSQLIIGGRRPEGEVRSPEPGTPPAAITPPADEPAVVTPPNTPV